MLCSLYQRMDVYASPGDVLGSIEQTWSILKPEFVVKDAAGNSILRIVGPFCTWSMCGDVEFEVIISTLFFLSCYVNGILFIR
jgi:hypothetical protein